MARQFATVVCAIAAANGASINEDDLIAAWGYAKPTDRPQTQEEANRKLRNAWG